jgi:hypothetical protein
VPLRRFFWPVFVVALALSSARPNAFDYSSQIGIVEFHPDDAACLTIQNASLKVGEAVRIIVMDEPQALETALVEKKLDKSCSRNPQVSPADAFYALRLPAKESVLKPVSIAVVRFAGELHLKDGFAQADLTANGSAHSFRSCTSTEGLHLTVWDSAPSRKWHRYYYLGYDVEPNCTEKEYSDKR